MAQRTLNIPYESRNRFQLGRDRPHITKDPDAVLDYVIDWSDFLRDDTIVTSSWVVDDGIIKDSDTNTTLTTTIWLSGGSSNGDYKVTNTITSAAGRTDRRSFRVRVENK